MNKKETKTTWRIAGIILMFLAAIALLCYGKLTSSQAEPAMMAIVHYLKGTKVAGTVTIVALGMVNAIFLVLPIISKLLFYDMWLYWVIAQMLADLILLGCLIREFVVTKEKNAGFILVPACRYSPLHWMQS